MAFDGTDPAWCLALPMTDNPKWRLRVAQFGDGYAQRTLDGINALDRSFDVRAEMKPESVLIAMDNYLVAQKANAFNFKNPATGVVYSVFCDEWHIDWLVTRFDEHGVRQNLNGTLSARFVQAYGLTA